MTENIEVRPSRDGKNCTYRVYLSYTKNGKTHKVTKSFSSKKYGSKKLAYDLAKDYRDKKRAELSTLAIIDVSCDLDRLILLKEETITHTVRTNEVHRLYYNKFIKPFTEGLDIKDVTAFHIQKTLNSMVAERTDDTIKRVFSIWKQLYKTALIHDLCSFDMTAKVILPKSDRIKVTRNKTTTYEDMELVCEGIRKHYEDRETGALIIHALHIMYFTGLRPQEVYALSKYNVDTKRRIIAVKSSVGSSSTGSGVIVHTKTPQSERDVYYPADLDEVFAELMAGGHDYLFMTKKGLLNGNKTSAIINRCRPVDFRQYNLRHQFSSDLIEKGVDVRTVQELMGHADPQMSINYARSREETKRKAIDSRFDRK